jgi:hypothetical protein
VKSLILLAVAVVIAARPAAAQATPDAADSAIVRAQQLASSNDSAGGRALLDSLLASALANQHQRGEATYWLARLAASAADRERVLSGLIIEYPFSPRVPRAFYEIGMLELARNDRDRAAVHLARFLTAAPEDSNRVSASLTLGRILVERGETGRGCAVLLAGRKDIPENAVEIRNQFEFSVARCQGVDTSTKSPPPTAVDTTPAPRRTGAFTVQVAAYDLKGPADRLATTLRAQGLEARVIGTAKPFRVRVGRYATRAEAEEVSRQVDTIAKSRSFVVVAGPEDR